MGTCQAVGEAEGALSQPHHEISCHPVPQPRFDEPAGEKEGDDDEPDDVAREGTAPGEALQVNSAEAGGGTCPLSGDSNGKVFSQGLWHRRSGWRAEEEVREYSLPRCLEQRGGDDTYLKAATKVSVLERTAVVNPRKAQAPTGRGLDPNPQCNSVLTDSISTPVLAPPPRTSFHTASNEAVS